MKQWIIPSTVVCLILLCVAADFDGHGFCHIGAGADGSTPGLNKVLISDASGGVCFSSASFSRNIMRVTNGSYTMLPTDCTVIETTNSQTITLPSAPNNGFVYKIGAWNTTVVAATQGGALIADPTTPGFGSTQVNVSSHVNGFEYDGTNWWITIIH